MVWVSSLETWDARATQQSWSSVARTLSRGRRATIMSTLERRLAIRRHPIKCNCEALIGCSSVLWAECSETRSYTVHTLRYVNNTIYLVNLQLLIKLKFPADVFTHRCVLYLFADSRNVGLTGTVYVITTLSHNVAVWKECVTSTTMFDSWVSGQVSKCLAFSCYCLVATYSWKRTRPVFVPSVTRSRAMGFHKSNSVFRLMVCWPNETFP